MISTRKIYNQIVDPVMMSRFDNYFRVISKNHPERVCRLYESTKVMYIGFTDKAMDMLIGAELNSSLLIRLSLVFALIHGLDKESIRPYTTFIKDTPNKIPMQVPQFWLRTKLVRDLGGTWDWLLGMLSYAVNRFADMYLAFDLKDATTYVKKDFDPSEILNARPKTNTVYAYDLLLIEYMLNKTPLRKYHVKFKPENNTLKALKNHLEKEGCEFVNNPQAVKLIERVIKNEISWAEIHQLAKLWGTEL